MGIGKLKGDIEQFKKDLKNAEDEKAREERKNRYAEVERENLLSKKVELEDGIKKMRGEEEQLNNALKNENKRAEELEYDKKQLEEMV